MELFIINDNMDTNVVNDCIQDEDYFYNHGCDWCNLVNGDGTCSLGHHNATIKTVKYKSNHTHRIEITNNGIAAVKCAVYDDMGDDKSK